MKLTIFRSSGSLLRWFSPASTRFSLGGLVALVLALSHADAQLTVTTLGGGATYGFVNGTTLTAKFHTPLGLALDRTGSRLYVADAINNAVRVLNLNSGTTSSFVTSASGISHPVGVAVDAAGTLYVLNQGTGNVLAFDSFANPVDNGVTENATGLGTANGIAVDNNGNIYVTHDGNQISKYSPSGGLLGTGAIQGATLLEGITIMNNGFLAIADFGSGSGNGGAIWTGSFSAGFSVLAGYNPNTQSFNAAGDHFGPGAFAQFAHPVGISAAGNGFLVVADQGNHRVKVIDPSGIVTNLYGVHSNFWITGSGTYPGWRDGAICPGGGDVNYNCSSYVEARLPGGVFVAPDASVYSAEDFYHIIRHVTGTGLTSPTGAASGTNGFVVATPTITPNSGYFPMGQLIQVFSPNPNVFYTTDGTEPTTNSFPVSMSGNYGVISFFNSTNDLTALRVKAFVGTNSSPSASGQYAPANNIGVPPAPTSDGALGGGIGSTIVVPIVANLQTNVQVKSYQFRVEVAPAIGTSPVGPGLTALSITTNDFIPLITANQGQNNTTGAVTVTSYTTNGITNGLVISAIGNANNIFFKKFAVVGLLKVPIPRTAHQGDTYSVNVLYPSATSDGITANVPLTTMSTATILVNNTAYLVGDTASSYGGWYDAAEFGDGNLVNADVNNAFFAAVGLRVPYAFSDVFNAMDAYPPDRVTRSGPIVGGDGQIRFNDWQIILNRALRLDTNNFYRVRNTNGDLVPIGPITLPSMLTKSSSPLTYSPGQWYRQVLLGATSVGGMNAGSVASVPLYVKLADGSSLSGLQFRALVTPQNGAPALTQAPQFQPDSSFPSPAMQQSFRPGETAFGWPLGSFSFGSRSSNFIGWLTFTIPGTAQAGQLYTISFTNADGSPDLSTQYDFETRSAYLALNAPAPAASICSDEWKLNYFGSLTDPNAADLADPDHDAFPNWMEFLAGTDPTDLKSKLQFSGVSRQVVAGQSQFVVNWLTAPGRAYEVQSSAAFSGSPWATLSTVSGDGSPTSLTYTNVAGTRYYRLHLLP